MTQILASFLLLFLFSVFQVKSQELCLSYTTYGEFHPEQSCASYCCGDCVYRYCCYDSYNRLDQTQCVAENCTDYYDSYGRYESAVDCNGGFCCGSCDSRYCGWFPPDRLNQKKCPSEISTKTPHSEDYFDLFYLMFIGGLFPVCICFIFICRICRNRRRRRAINNNNDNNNTRINRNYITNPIIQQSNIRTNNGDVYEPISGQSYPRPVPIVTSNNSTSNSDVNKIYNTYASDDLPPSYDTIVAKQMKTEETVAENP